MRKIKVSEELIKLKEVTGEKIYLSDLEEFKDNNIKPLFNTVFNKTVTGIGGTSLALNSNENIIILMPFVEVVNNKDGYNKDTFIVKEGVTIAGICKYLKSNISNRKIVSTYDGLVKILSAYDKCGINIYEDFLLIDEWQVIFQQYGLRHNAMLTLLRESVKFKNKCFMTATPINKDYWFKEIKELEELKLDYDINPVVLRHFNCKSVIDEAIAIIKDKPINNNLHFFINSVETIKIIVNRLKIDPKDVRIICSKQDKNKYKLNGYSIESTKDPVKKYNFYTSTCFEGCDIFDENGLIYVLCDGSKAHSLVDMSTTLYQIAGRIRDIKDNTVNLIYSLSRYLDVSEEDFKKSTENNIRKAQIALDEIKSEENFELLDISKANDRYLVIEDGKLRFEEILLNVDRSNFELSKTYSLKANIIAKSSQIFIPITVEKPWAEQLLIDEKEKINKMSFKDKCLSYLESKTNKFSFNFDYDKDVKDAVDILGIKRLEELNFHKGDIKKILVGKMDISDTSKIMKCLKFSAGEFIETSKLRSIFREIYSSFNIKKTAKGSDIMNFYDVKDNKEIVKRIDIRDKTTGVITSTPTKGYIIIRSKTIFK